MNKAVLCLLRILSFALLISSCKEQSSYNGHEYVDLGLSVKWATCNVGAQNPEDYGNFYAWGETRPKSRYSLKGYRFRASGDAPHNVKFSKYDPDDKSGPFSKKVLELADDVANLEWGGSWRMPTKEEIMELNWNCDWVWTTQNGVKGVKITSKVEGYTDRSIFMPAAGYRTDSRHLFPGVSGDYWSSTNSISKTSAYSLYFDSCGSSLDNSIVAEIGLDGKSVLEELGAHGQLVFVVRVVVARVVAEAEIEVVGNIKL